MMKKKKKGIGTPQPEGFWNLRPWEIADGMVEQANHGLIKPFTSFYGEFWTLS